MPYDTVSDLPEDFNKYGSAGRRAALDVLNGCMYEGDEDEQTCFRRAHMAAKKASEEGGGSPKGPGGGGRRRRQPGGRRA